MVKLALSEHYSVNKESNEQTMAWEMKWYDEYHTILVFTVNPTSTWDDFHTAMNTYADELRKTDKVLHAIIYNEYGFLSANPVPHVKLQMAKLAEFSNKGLLITVSPKLPTGFLESVAMLVLKFMDRTLKKGMFVKSMDASITRIQREQSAVAV